MLGWFRAQRIATLFIFYYDTSIIPNSINLDNMMISNNIIVWCAPSRQIMLS